MAINPKNEADAMAQKMAMIEKQNRQMMKLLSQLPGALTPSNVKHRDGYATSTFVEQVANAALPKKLNLLILTPTHDGSTDPMEHVARYKQRMWQASIP